MMLIISTYCIDSSEVFLEECQLGVDGAVSSACRPSPPPCPSMLPLERAEASGTLTRRLTEDEAGDLLSGGPVSAGITY